MKLKNIVLTSFFLTICSPSFASFADELSDFKGGKIAEVGTVTGFIDKDGKIKDSFEGCDYERKIIIDNRTTVTCKSYNYRYSYRPKAVLIEKNYGYDMLLIIDNEIYKVRKN